MLYLLQEYLEYRNIPYTRLIYNRNVKECTVAKKVFRILHIDVLLSNRALLSRPPGNRINKSFRPKIQSRIKHVLSLLIVQCCSWLSSQTPKIDDRRNILNLSNKPVPITYIFYIFYTLYSYLAKLLVDDCFGWNITTKGVNEGYGQRRCI